VWLRGAWSKPETQAGSALVLAGIVRCNVSEGGSKRRTHLVVLAATIAAASGCNELNPLVRRIHRSRHRNLHRHDNVRV